MITMIDVCTDDFGCDFIPMIKVRRDEICTKFLGNNVLKVHLTFYK